jgi:hypothetical protein
MSYLNQVSTGYEHSGSRIVIGGLEKVGKTTLACAAPGALLIPLEQGSGAMPVAKTPMLTTYEQIMSLCEEVRQAAIAGHIPRGSSLVWDSGTALERAIESYTLRCDKDYSKKGSGVTMISAHGGYGKAYEVARQNFEAWLRYQDELAFNAGINIIITCHVFASRVIDPAHGEYDTWDLLLHSPKNNKTYGIREYLTQWADLIGFMHEPMFVMKAAEGANLNQAMSKNEGRVLAVDRTPAWIAGNRWGLTGSLRIPAPQPGTIAVDSWNAIAAAAWEATGNRIDIWNRANKGA